MYPDELANGRNRERASGHRYQHVHVSGGKAHFGDTCHVGLDDPLRHLPYAEDAPFNAYTKQHESTCLPETRVDLLKVIHSWADELDERCIFWLSGLAGTGKSTISRTVARSYYDKQRLAASFFFSRGGGDVSHAGRFVTSIAVQLALNVPACRQHICEAIANRSDIASLSLRDQWQHLVLGPLSQLAGSSSYVLVVDALDECDNDDNTRFIVQLLAEGRSLTSVRLRVFLTSRPEVPIRHGFYQIADAEHQDYVLHNISPSMVDHDIRLFFQHNLQLIARECRQAAGWPGADIVVQLVQSASGLFIWAATACRFIREGKRFAVRRLDAILSSNSATPGAPEIQLNEIYTTVLESSIYTGYTEEEKEEQCAILRRILGNIVVLFAPLSVASLNQLLEVAEGVQSALEDLHAILDIPNNQSRPLRLHHPSFRDFLLDKDRCGDAFWVDGKQAHAALADSCMQLMSSSLKQDICGVDAPGTLAAEAGRTRLDEYLPPELQYACRYWVQHLAKGGPQLRDDGQVHQFLQEHFLHWLEVLGWMGKVSEGIYAISTLDSVTVTSNCPILYAFVHDMKRFALHSRAGIEQAPLQVYCSGLVFSPTKSLVRKQFVGQMPKWIMKMPQVDSDWSAVLQTLEGHSNIVNAVAFSPDGKVLASASRDETVKLWDASTGAVMQTLEGHSDWVNAVAFSSDGKVLASASGDGTVKLWDASTGAVMHTLKGHSDGVTAVAFSADGKVLASASRDWTVKLWDASTGVVMQTLEGHSSGVNAVAFSSDGRVLASGSEDKTVKLWDASTGAMMQTLEGHSNWVNAVAFSPDGKVLTSTSSDKTIKLWDASTGAVMQTLEGHSYWVNAVAFSPDGKVLASASRDTTVKLWDKSTGAVIQTLEGHLDRVNAVAFSPDGKVLASASGDETVKLWDASTGAVMQTLEGHSYWVNAVAFSPDGKVLASTSYDKTIKLWDASTGAVMQTLKGHSDMVNVVAFSPDSKVLASTSYDTTVKLWDASTGAVMQTLKGHSDMVNVVAFSPDSKVLASASHDKTIKLWDASTGVLVHNYSVHAVVWELPFSDDGVFLQTDRGLIHTSLPYAATAQQSVPPETFVQEQWITHQSLRMLWLPPEFRGASTAVWGNVVALGQRSGRVSLLAISM